MIYKKVNLYCMTSRSVKYFRKRNHDRGMKCFIRLFRKHTIDAIEQQVFFPMPKFPPGRPVRAGGVMNHPAVFECGTEQIISQVSMMRMMNRQPLHHVDLLIMPGRMMGKRDASQKWLDVAAAVERLKRNLI